MSSVDRVCVYVCSVHMCMCRKDKFMSKHIDREVNILLQVLYIYVTLHSLGA